MRILSCLAAATLAIPALAAPVPTENPKLRVLLIDGQNNHNWKATTPVLRKHLEASGRFEVAVATAPPANDPAAMAKFNPSLANVDVIVSNYNGAAWPKEFQQAFAGFVEKGGGLAVVHAADNSFPEWPEYNAMIGVGGWGGRTEKSGPYLRIRDGKQVLDPTPGRGGSHGKQHEFVVQTVTADHPITAGIPAKWLHAQDELYDRLRGPAKNVTILAAAFADPKTGGSGQTEPMLMAIGYGKGRVFHTTLGHDLPALRCVGFATTFQRGTEWAATGKVTIPVPANFPTAQKTSSVE